MPTTLIWTFFFSLIHCSVQQVWPPTSRFCCDSLDSNTPGFQHGKRPVICPSFDPCYTVKLNKARDESHLFQLMANSPLLPLFRLQLPSCPKYPTFSGQTLLTPPLTAPPPSLSFTEDCRTFSSLAITYPDTIYGVTPIRTLDVTQYTVCRYVIDFSSVKRPFSITKVYFNERIQEDAIEHLEVPLTTPYFDPVKRGNSQGYFAFPYFIVIRGLCDDADFYGQDIYFQIGSVSMPKITFTYFPKTGRAVYENALRLSIDSVAIDLVQDREKLLVPDPGYVRLKNKDGTLVCSNKICHPGWISPFPFLHIPIVEISLPDKRTFASLKKTLYLNPWHARYSEGYGELEIAQEFETLDGKKTRVSEVSPRYLFPKQRKYEYDTDIVNLGWLPEAKFPYQYQEGEDSTGLDWDGSLYKNYCFIPENRKITYEFDIPPTFHFMGLEPVLAWALEELQEYRSHYPLTREDFIIPKYALGNTPTVMLAGFYRPDLLLVGDPDMGRIEMIQWEYDNLLEKDKNIFGSSPNGQHPKCVTDKNRLFALEASLDPKNNDPVFRKPVYSYRDYDLRGSVYGRRSYYPLNYSSPLVKAVFDVLNFEDRVILKTLDGLVTLYGNTNASISLERNFQAPQNERLEGCFKIVRMNQVALGGYDPIVAVTYGDENRNIPQKIWYGTVKGASDPNGTKWVEIGANEYKGDNKLPPPHLVTQTSHISQQSQSEALKICYLVFQKRIISLFQIDAKSTVVFQPTDPVDPDKCDILDAIPVPVSPTKIMVLVQMVFKFYRNLECNIDSYKAQTQGHVVDCEYNRRKCLRFLYCKQKYKSAPVKHTPTHNHPYLTCKQRYGSWLAGHYNRSFPWNKNYKSSYDEIQAYLIDELNNRYATPLSNTEYLQLNKNPINGPLFDGDINTQYDDQEMCEQYDNTHFEIPRSGAGKRIWEKAKYESFSKATGRDKEEIFTHFCDFRFQRVPVYVLAVHDVMTVMSEGPSWKIVNIYPEIPCEVEHLEPVKTLQPFGPNYFPQQSLDVPILSCFEKYTGYTTNRLDINGFTFTRQVNNHLFLYGTRLYHSPDGGRTLQVYRDFPVKPGIFNPLDFDMGEIINMNRIKVMAFSSKGQFAFLTSKRELWIGNTGTDRLIRIRPSDGWSMLNLRIYKFHKGVHSAIPFSVFYDSHDKLFELVALRDSGGHIQQVMKRSITQHYLFRNEILVDNIHAVINEHMFKQISLCFKPPIKPSSECLWPEPERETVEPITSLFQLTPDSTILPISFSILDLAVYCPFSQLKVKQNYSKTLNRLQQFHIASPFQHLSIGQNYSLEGLMAFSVGAFQMVYDAYLRLDQVEHYSRVKPDPFEKWKKSKKDTIFTGLINYYRREPENFGLFIDPRLSVRNIDVKDAASRQFIHSMWLDYNQTVEIQFSFFLKNPNLLSKTDFLRQKLTEIQVNIDNGNTEIISVSSERHLEGQLASVKFITLLNLNRSSRLKQYPPGRGLRTVPITFHLINSLGRCHDLPHWGMVGESIALNILAGCQPATDLLFDWNTTLYSLQFRNPNLKYGDKESCYKQAHVCFYAKEDVILNFDVLNLSKQIYVPYNGKYKLKVIGGGSNKESLIDFSEAEIEAFNIPGKSDISLIWTLSTQENTTDSPKDPETEENILEAGVTRIKWACNSLSPCAIVGPKLNLRTVYYFKLKITNLNVDPDTLCLHEREFIMMVYGFPPSPEILLIASFICCLVIILFLNILYLCCRRQRVVWRSSKLKIWGWIKIVLDTMPRPTKKKLSYYDEQLRKDNILLSLQGHLRVPSVVFRKEEDSPSIQSLAGTKSSGSSSVSSIRSSEVIPEVRQRPAAGTWTDMVYEQIISRRLISIIERNKRLRQGMEEHTAFMVEEREKIDEKKKKKKKHKSDKK